jgi:hypothetical protein
MPDDNSFCIFLIKNISNEKKFLIDFISELEQTDPIVKEYPSARLWTDTFGVLPREYDPKTIYEVKFVVDVCILGRMMNKVKSSGKLPSFSYVKIRDNQGFFLPTGVRLSDPYTTASKAAKRFIEENA